MLLHDQDIRKHRIKCIEKIGLIHICVAIESDELSPGINAKYIYLYYSDTTISFLLIQLIKTVFDTLRDIIQI